MKRTYWEQAYLVSMIAGLVSYLYLIYSRVGFFYKLHMLKVYQEVIFNPVVFIPLSFFLLAAVFIFLDIRETKKTEKPKKKR